MTRLPLILLILTLSAFSVVVGYALYLQGVRGMYETVISSPMTIAMTFDLVCGLAIGMLWTWRDARARGVSAAPYFVLTVIIGCPGLLLYLIRRELDRDTAPILE